MTSIAIFAVTHQFVAISMLSIGSDTTRTCGQPIISPNGERIAYLCTRDKVDNIFVAAASGMDERQLTNGGISGNTPRWTADGSAVLFSGSGADTGRVFAVEVSGARRREMAVVPGRTPVLSPDGKRVLYSVGSFIAARIVVSNVDGSDAHQITGSGTAWNATWSPDGKRIAYTHGESARALNIWVVNSDGAAPQEVAYGPQAGEVAEVPGWSNDGKRIAFQMSNRSAHSAYIAVVDVDAPSTPARPIVPGDGTHTDETPQWFPDGKSIAFQSNRSGRMEVWIVRADGTGLHRLTR
jgi:Tol biopolymer transport system component